MSSASKGSHCHKGSSEHLIRFEGLAGVGLENAYAVEVTSTPSQGCAPNKTSIIPTLHLKYKLRRQANPDTKCNNKTSEEGHSECPEKEENPVFTADAKPGNLRETESAKGFKMTRIPKRKHRFKARWTLKDEKQLDSTPADSSAAAASSPGSACSRLFTDLS
jgi:hypothetical protein